MSLSEILAPCQYSYLLIIIKLHSSLRAISWLIHENKINKHSSGRNLLTKAIFNAFARVSYRLECACVRIRLVLISPQHSFKDGLKTWKKNCFPKIKVRPREIISVWDSKEGLDFYYYYLFAYSFFVFCFCFLFSASCSNLTKRRLWALCILLYCYYGCWFHSVSFFFFFMWIFYNTLCGNVIAVKLISWMSS